MGQKDPPRVCLLTETFYPVVGGGETHARLLAGRLNSVGMATFVLTRRSDPAFPRSGMVDNTPVYRIGPSGIKRFGKYAMLPFAMYELFRRRQEYDVILVCGFRVLGIPAVTAASALDKTCVLRAEMYGEMSGGYASAYRKLPAGMGFIFRQWVNLRNLVLRKADAFVSISRPISEEIEEIADPERVFRIPNGIPSELFRPVGTEARRLLRERLGLPSDGAIAVYSGKLNRGKGLEYLIRAWSTVASLHENACLALVGSGGGQSLSIENDLRRMVDDMGLGPKVIFIGYTDRVHEYLQTADLFVLPSENEGLPMSLIEAMSCGLPSIATRVGGIPEVVRHIESGILVEPRDSDGLAQAIRDVIEQPALASSLAGNARRTVRECYSIEAVADSYYRLFCSLQARKSGIRDSRECPHH